MGRQVQAIDESAEAVTITCELWPVFEERNPDAGQPREI
jgi:hypothetical protein